MCLLSLAFTVRCDTTHPITKAMATTSITSVAMSLTG